MKHNTFVIDTDTNEIAGYISLRNDRIGQSMEIHHEQVITCEFNIDTACVGLRFADGSMTSINCTVVENKVADNMYQRSELDYLIYNDPVVYADLILNGGQKVYLKTVTEYVPME